MESVRAMCSCASRAGERNSKNTASAGACARAAEKTSTVTIVSATTRWIHGGRHFESSVIYRNHRNYRGDSYGRTQDEDFEIPQEQEKKPLEAQCAQSDQVLAVPSVQTASYGLSQLRILRWPRGSEGRRRTLEGCPREDRCRRHGW